MFKKTITEFNDKEFIYSTKTTNIQGQYKLNIFILKGIIMNATKLRFPITNIGLPTALSDKRNQFFLETSVQRICDKFPWAERY